MTPGPLRRITAAVGLVALVPIALLLASGALDPEEALLRAAIVTGVVVGLGSLARAVLTRLLRRFERRAADGERTRPTATSELGVAD